jgi:YwiC-like protein
MSATLAAEPAISAERPLWRSVAIPSEHGGWGLTLEPVLLGLLVAFSGAGVAIGAAAFVAFLVRTPLKLALVDRRRRRTLPRTRLAARVAAGELAALVALGSFALWSAGADWLIPVAIAAPFIALELWFDVRSRGRRLVPELAGAVGISAVAAAIAIAGDEGWRLAFALWLLLAARAMSSIPYVRTQIARTRRGAQSLAATDRVLVAGAAVALSAVVVEPRAAAGAVAVGAVAVAHGLMLRRDHIAPVKIIGMRQMAIGVAVVAASAIGAMT